MAYDIELAERIRETLDGQAGVSEKPMFGGLAFMINGNMAVAASHHGGLLLRVDPAQSEELVREEYVDRFEMRGKAMDGWLGVEAAAVVSDASLRRWVGYGLAYAAGLPPK